MALIFDYEKDIEAGIQPFISHERDSTMYNYYISDENAIDKFAYNNYGDYTDTIFINEDRHLTTKPVTRIGVKNFPGIGGIGFYKDAYTNDSFILAPIHIRNDLQEAPVLKTVEIVDGMLHIVIEPNDNISYTCYRVVVRQREFAFEYITYKTDYYVDKPTVKGDYVVYCIGYDEDMGTISENSNELALTVTSGENDWEPHFESITNLENRIEALENSTGGDDLTRLEGRVETLEESIDTIEGSLGAIDIILDEINGEEV